MSQPGPHSSSACGKACLASHLQEGPCTGKFITSYYPISGEIDTYIALPPGKTMEEVKNGKAKKVLFWCCDVYGPRFINNQLLMDWVASQGVCVFGPEWISYRVPCWKSTPYQFPFVFQHNQDSSSFHLITSITLNSPSFVTPLDSHYQLGFPNGEPQSKIPMGKRFKKR